jgi:hypothetical protein
MESAGTGSKEKQAQIVKMCKPSSLPTTTIQERATVKMSNQGRSPPSETIIKEERAFPARKEHTMTKPMNFIPGGHYTLNGIPYQVLTPPDNKTLVVKNLEMLGRGNLALSCASSERKRGLTEEQRAFSETSREASCH